MAKALLCRRQSVRRFATLVGTRQVSLASPASRDAQIAQAFMRAPLGCLSNAMAGPSRYNGLPKWTA